MSLLVAGQDPAGAVAVARALGAAPAFVGADGALSLAPGTDRAVYVLDSCVPADPVDALALARLRGEVSTTVVATGADVYPEATAVRAESARRLNAQVLPVEPARGTGFDEVRAALEAVPEPTPAAAPEAGRAPAPRPNPALERADRSAYLRSTIARLRAALLAESAEKFRGREEETDPDGVRERLASTTADLQRSADQHLRAAYRGTFAGWGDPPVPAPVALPRPDVPEPEAHRRRPEDAAVLVLGASAGLGIGRAVAAPLEALGALRWLALPISLAVGLAAALWLLRVRRRTTTRATLRSWSDGVTAAHRQRAEFELAAALVAAESDAALRLARGEGTAQAPGASNGYGP